MQTKDHFTVARYMAAQFHITNPLYRGAFLLGNIMPDIDKLSYVQGYLELKKYAKNHRPAAWRLSHKERLTWNDHRCLMIGGHTAEGSRKYLNRRFRGLNQKHKYNVRDYYHMGKLLHYLVDSFTYPHTMEYHDGFLAHVSFEEQLHRICKPYTFELNSICRDCAPNISLSTLYKAYRSEKPNPYNDYVYILVAYTNCMRLLCN